MPRRPGGPGGAHAHDDAELNLTLGGRSTHLYGAPRESERPIVRDTIFLRGPNPELAATIENDEKERLDKEDTLRVSDDELKKVDVLTVVDLDLHIKDNATSHHTSMYYCVNAEDSRPVLRRGAVFKVTLTFNRKYNKKKDDLHFIFSADVGNPAKNLQVTFTLDEERWEKYEPKTDEDWMARIVRDPEADKNKLSVEVYIPGNCVVAEWELKVKTTLVGSKEDYVMIYPKPLAILFNPWSEADTVFFTEDQPLLKEYVLNEAGTVFVGTSSNMSSSAWIYGQFEKGILQTSFSLLRKAFNFKMTPVMANAVEVSRALSRVVNSIDDQGVLVGNWSGDYDDGKAPWVWKASTSILRQYADTGEPVKYGQCWVFSHVLTTVCRALGLPTRSVTNFDSAHDTDSTCTIDKYFNEKDEPMRYMTRDSIWNFHVWNEVWLLRPDLPPGYDGWHCIDATPQEQSLGLYQCGPCPVKAVKKGEIHIGYDTAFVFSEVNAEVVHWIVAPDEVEVTRYSSIDHKYVGAKISTKFPDGKPTTNIRHLGGWGRKDDSKVRLDITDTYKFKEGSPEEREAVKRAVRFTRHGKTLYQKDAELEVTIIEGKQTMVGQDLVVEAKVKNISKDEKRVAMTMTSRTTSYWDNSRSDDTLSREIYNVTVIKPGQEEMFKLTTPASVYTEMRAGLNLSSQFHVYACARDVDKSMPYSTQRPFRLTMPSLKIEGPKSAMSGEAVTVTVSFTNPLPQITLTNVTFEMTGGLTLAGEDDPRFELLYGTYTAQLEDIGPKETRTVTVQVKGETEVPEGQSKQVALTFDTNELPDVTGSYELEIKYVAPTEKPAVEEAGPEAMDAD